MNPRAAANDAPPFHSHSSIPNLSVPPSVPPSSIADLNRTTRRTRDWTDGRAREATAIIAESRQQTESVIPPLPPLPRHRAHASQTHCGCHSAPPKTIFSYYRGADARDLFFSRPPFPSLSRKGLKWVRGVSDLTIFHREICGDNNRNRFDCSAARGATAPRPSSSSSWKARGARCDAAHSLAFRLSNFSECDQRPWKEERGAASEGTIERTNLDEIGTIKARLQGGMLHAR